jgi:hypothetical protein
VGALLLAPPAAAAAPLGARPAEALQPFHSTAAPPSGPCGVSRPASAGRLTLNPSAVERGGTVVAVVTELPRFPEQIVGAGSLEFFGFCLPSPAGERFDIGMSPLEGPVVVPLQVREDTPLGRHLVAVVFSEGRAGFSAEAEDEVLLTAPLEVTAQPPPLRAADPDTPPCGLVAGTPPSGVRRPGCHPLCCGTGGRAARPARRAARPSEERHRLLGSLRHMLRRAGGGRPATGRRIAGRLATPAGGDRAHPCGSAAGPAPAPRPRAPRDPTPSWVAWTSTVTVGAAGRPVPRGGVDAGLAPGGAELGRKGAVLVGGLVLLAALGATVYWGRRRPG